MRASASRLVRRRQRLEMKVFDPALTPLELALGTLRAAELIHGSLVLGAKMPLQFGAPRFCAPASENERGNRNHDCSDTQRDQGPHLFAVSHGLSPEAFPFSLDRHSACQVASAGEPHCPGSSARPMPEPAL